ncbi:hypothetical protein HDU98_009254 [Podochytrium sp. JEL0797]|nr:hypothetical protein HDU98_009254 [Podochytrium sp. JEL0797]
MAAHLPRRASSVSMAAHVELPSALCVMRNALHVVINHVDAKGRFVAELFITLVDRAMYPDYYRVIANPVAIDTMLTRIDNGHYARFGPQAGLAAFEADFATMAANAMTYNQPASDVFKDAKALQVLFNSELAKEIKLAESDPQAVKYKTIVNNIMAHQDHTDRYVWDVFFELPDKKLYKDYYFSIKNPIALDVILSKIDAHQYKTDESFAADMHLMVKNAKTYNVEGSQIYRDALLLEAFFKEQFARFVVNNAGSGGARGMSVNIAATPTSAGPKSASSTGPPIVEGEALENVVVDGQTYRAGDYVLIKNPVDPTKPTIGQIQSTYKSVVTGKPTFTASWFLRPHQTYQLQSAKFMDNEVLKTNRLESYDAVDAIVGRCWVLYVKDYVRGRPKEAPEGDLTNVFCCESRYTIEGKATSRIKLWQGKFPDPELVLYDVPLVPLRVPMFNHDAAVGAGGGGDHGKKRKSEDFGDSPREDPEFHQDKKIKMTLSKPHGGMSTPSHGHGGSSSNTHHSTRDRSKSHHGHIPSLSQQVASLVLPGTKAAAAQAALLQGATGGGGSAANNSNNNSGTATPNHGHHATADAKPAAPVNPSDAAGALGPIFELFDRTPAGEVKWYAGLPVDVVKREVVEHSLQYRVAKMKERKAAAAAAAGAAGGEETKNGDAMNVDVSVKLDSGSLPQQQQSPVQSHPQAPVDLEEQLWKPMKRAFYDLAHAFLA